VNLRLDAPKSEGGEGELSKFQETERLINPMAGDSEVLTVKEVCVLLRVHPNTVYKMVRHGKIPSFRIGTEWRFRHRRFAAALFHAPLTLCPYLGIGLVADVAFQPILDGCHAF